jgi:hypothetical protein
MLRVSPIVLIAAATLASARPLHQNEALSSYRDTHQGTVRPLQSIEAGVVPHMKQQGASYIGAEYNAQSLQYRLKFMNDGSVIWIDVDGRSGAVVGQAGQ